MAKKPQNKSTYEKIVVGDDTNSPIKRVLGDKPLSDKGSPIRTAFRWLGKAI